MATLSKNATNQGLNSFTKFSLLLLVISFFCSCGDGKPGDKIATVKGPIEQIDPSKVCIKHVKDLIPSTLLKVGDQPASKAMDKSNPPIFQFAVINLEIDKFDPNFPPVIETFDEKTGFRLDSISFKPLIHPCEHPVKQSVPIYLAYDPTPWMNAGQEPVSRTTRIVVRNPALKKSQTYYARLHHPSLGGVYVVPVAWHNLAESKYGGKSNVDNQDVIRMFWSAPEMKQYVQGAIVTDENTIWAQAGVQFRLINTAMPAIPVDIPTHILNAPDEAKAKGCQLFWANSLSNKTAVDIYTLHDLQDMGGNKIAGLGNCLADGFILIEEPSAGSSVNLVVVAHEFGHYLAQMCHVDVGTCGSNYGIPTGQQMNNLMHSMSADWELKPKQVQEIRSRIKLNIKRDQGYNHQK
jgi:hypothetical protein